MLAALGAIFAAAGVGDDHRRDRGLDHSRTAASSSPSCCYALGMVVFTMIMGNAFAAFPVMAAAIGVPILIQQRRRQSGGDRRGRHARAASAGR